MPTYRVPIRREVIYEAYVTVDSQNPDMARDAALMVARRTVEALPWAKVGERDLLVPGQPIAAD